VIRNRRGPSLAAALLPLLLSRPGFAADEIHYTLTGPTSVTFDWRGTDASMRYGFTTSYGKTATGMTPSPLPFSSAGPFWEARLTGLLPDTPYHYSIGGGADRVFHTQPGPNNSFTVYAEADVGDSVTYPRVPIVQSLIAAGAPAFTLVVGDLTYGDDDGQAVVDQHFNDVMAWSRESAYMPAWGNHEWNKSTDDLRNYKGRFDLPNPQASPGAPSAGCCGEDWYWFDTGGVRFIAYPEPYTGATWSDWDVHAKTLMDQAQADTSIHFIVTFGHRPAYSSGYHSGDPELQGYMDALGAAHSKYVLNLNGHSHDYERSYPQHGVTHTTIGIGGSTLEELSGSCLYSICPPPAWSAFRAYHHGALRLAISRDRIHGEAICGPPGDTGANKNDITCTLGDVFDAWTVGADRKPEVIAPARVVKGAGGVVTVQVYATDPDGDEVLALTADLSRLPAGNNAQFAVAPGNASGTLTWTPPSSNTGIYRVVFHATNALTDSAVATIYLGASTAGVPRGAEVARLAIDRVTPNPASNVLHVFYRLANDAPARLELLDASGRVVLRRWIDGLEPGTREVELAGMPRTSSGTYWLHLSQEGRTSSVPVVLVH
jgi:hypothetical protein